MLARHCQPGGRRHPAPLRRPRQRAARSGPGPAHPARLVQARNLEELELQQPFAERTLRPLVARLSRMGGRLSSASSTETAEKRLAMAGNPGDLKLTDWMGVKMLAGIATGVDHVPPVRPPGGGGISPGVLLRRSFSGCRLRHRLPRSGVLAGQQIKARQKIILKMIPDTLDLLTISVRAGLGFDAALAKVVEKLPGPLTDEFRRALAEVRVGKARRDALRDMIPRTNVQPLSNFIGAIIQAETLGVSISKVLQVQSEQLRIERRQRAEEKAARAPIKMLFPLVGCIFPSLFIVILGPAIISIVKTLAAASFRP